MKKQKLIFIHKNGTSTLFINKRKIESEKIKQFLQNKLEQLLHESRKFDCSEPIAAFIIEDGIIIYAIIGAEFHLHKKEYLEQFGNINLN